MRALSLRTGSGQVLVGPKCAVVGVAGQEKLGGIATLIARVHPLYPRFIEEEASSFTRHRSGVGFELKKLQIVLVSQ